MGQHSYVMVVKIADLKNNLSRHLGRVRQGAEITVYDRDTPVARIVPFTPGAAADSKSRGKAAEASAARVAGMARQGVLAPGDPRGVAAWLDDNEPIGLPDGTPGAVEVLLAMRRESQR